MDTQSSNACRTTCRTIHRTTRQRITLATSFFFLLLPVVVLADVCSYEKTVAFTVPAESINQLEIDAHAGSLVVEAASGSSEISVVGTVCSSRKSELVDMDVLQSREGSVLKLETLIPEFHGSLWTSRYAYIDLAVTVPAGLAVAIDDGSGPLDVSGTGNLRIKDGSGEIKVHAIMGNVVIRDGSGELSVEDVDGSVEVRDGSGAVDISYVMGDVDVEDGSGTLRIAQVGGSVGIHDGSGSIDVRDVQQEVVIHEDGSGSLDMRRVNIGGGD
ncbi:MAG: hypothetical protein WBJ75_14845 [Pseudohongiellaceae bacterium]